MKIAALLIAVTAAIASHAYGASNDGQPIRWHKHDGGEVIMRMSTDQLRINNSGDPLDKLHSFTCKSPAGCVVILNASGLWPSSDQPALFQQPNPIWGNRDAFRWFTGAYQPPAYFGVVDRRIHAF